MMFLEGNIAAPPTITVFSPDISLFGIFLSSALAGTATLAARASALNATAERTAIRFDMDGLPMDEWPADIRQRWVGNNGAGRWRLDCAVIGPSYGRVL